MVFHESLFSLLPSLLVSVLMAWAMIRVSIHLIKEQKKEINVKRLLEELGFKNFKVTDLNDISPEGFQRLIVLIRELKPPTGALAELQALASIARPPTAAAGVEGR